MKEYISEAIRNIALVGHGGSGKTSLSEIILYTAKETNRIGKIEDGNTVSDYTPNEIDKQISISSSLMNVEWNNTKINILDAPGFSDFIGDVKSALKVSDAAVLLIKSSRTLMARIPVDSTHVQCFHIHSRRIRVPALSPTRTSGTLRNKPLGAPQIRNR